MIRLAAIAALTLLAACATGNDLDEDRVPLGNFALGHNVVVAPNLVKGPLSREASAEEWTTAMHDAIEARFGRYESGKLYNFGTSVEGYVLAQPGVPLVMSPKSVLIVRLTVWDDAKGEKVNDEPEELTVIESLTDGALIGSGYTLTREEQMERLARGMAKQIERLLVKRNRYEGWFGGRNARPAATATAPAGAAGATAEAAPGQEVVPASDG